MPVLIYASKRVLVAMLALVTAFTTACASGGFRLTRRYAGFVNRQNVVLRVILYVLTLPIFWVTLLIDEVINNTVDFWEGRVAQGTFRFSEGGRIFVARHDIDEAGLKSSHIEVFGADNIKIQDVRLAQVSNSQIEVYVDGVLKHRVSDIHALPQLTTFNGRTQSTRSLSFDEQRIASR